MKVIDADGAAFGVETRPLLLPLKYGTAMQRQRSREGDESNGGLF